MKYRVRDMLVGMVIVAIYALAIRIHLSSSQPDLAWHTRSAVAVATNLFFLCFVFLGLVSTTTTVVRRLRRREEIGRELLAWYGHRTWPWHILFPTAAIINSIASPIISLPWMLLIASAHINVTIGRQTMLGDQGASLDDKYFAWHDIRLVEGDGPAKLIESRPLPHHRLLIRPRASVNVPARHLDQVRAIVVEKQTARS